jgi:hypothetical protein
MSKALAVLLEKCILGMYFYLLLALVVHFL